MLSPSIGGGSNASTNASLIWLPTPNTYPATPFAESSSLVRSLQSLRLIQVMPVLVRRLKVSTSRPEKVITWSTAGCSSRISVRRSFTASVRCNDAASCRIGITIT